MKKKWVMILSLVTISIAGMLSLAFINEEESIIYDDFNDGLIPEGWQEDRTDGAMYVEELESGDHRLTLRMDNNKPYAIRTFDPVSGKVNVFFKYRSSRNWINVRLYLKDNEGNTVSQVVFGNAGTKGILLVTKTDEQGNPVHMVNALTENFEANQDYFVFLEIDLHNGTQALSVDDGERVETSLLTEGNEISRLEFDHQMMYSNNGNIYLDNVVVVIGDGVWDKYKLQSLIDEARLAVDLAEIGDQPHQYPESAIRHLQHEITLAENVYDNENSTVEEIKQAREQLQVSIQSFHLLRNERNNETVVTYDSLGKIVEWFLTESDHPGSDGLIIAFQIKLTHAKQAFEEGNIHVKETLLYTFKQHVNAQKNKALDEQQADLLLQFSDELSSKIEINSQNAYQEITLMGGDMERNPGFLLQANNPEEIAQWLFRDINFNVVRVQYDKHQELIEGEKNFDFYDKQVEVMKLVKEVNPDIKFFAVLRTDYMVYSKDLSKPETINNWPRFIFIPKLNDKGQMIGVEKPFDPEKYGRFLADYVMFMYNEGVPIHYLNTGKESTGIIDAEISKRSIEVMNQILEEQNIPKPLIVAPGAWGIPSSTKFVNDTVQKGYEDYYYAFSTHNLKPHGAAEWEAFTSAVHATGKNAWDEESSTASGGRTSGVEPSISAILTKYKDKFISYQNGLNGEIFFEVFSRGIASETRSVYFRAGEDGRRMRSYYVMKEFANTLIGKTRIEANVAQLPGISQIAFKSDDEIVLWIINESDTSYKKIPLWNVDDTMNMNNGDMLYWSDFTAIEGSLQPILPTQDGFTIDLEARSIARIKFDL